MRRSSYIKRETHAIISTGEGGGINEFVANDISQLKRRSENMEKSLGFLAKKFINLDEKIDKLLELGVRPGHQANGDDDSQVTGTAFVGQMMNDAAVCIQTSARGMFGRKKVEEKKRHDNEERAAVVIQTEARGMFGRKKVKDIKAQRSP